ncbi:hypothetical protein JOC86_000363 [Bacillus pakistanensis]|uniref:Uncharacterized protein n=1 Tax=Rossellomorea pakistanensis TaxID=992288 RepID=A0ABS2N8A7_9BACI|nr:hypothetical protein [Bacillus pakistanensis]MBM7583826.1 hypothetical protein [Bacillus pakistanensis]
MIFNLITLSFVLRSGVLAVIKTYLILEYGVEAFDKGIIVRQVLSWLLTGISVLGFLYIGKIINDSPELIEKVRKKMEVRD